MSTQSSSGGEVAILIKQQTKARRIRSVTLGVVAVLLLIAASAVYYEHHHQQQLWLQHQQKQNAVIQENQQMLEQLQQQQQQLAATQKTLIEQLAKIRSTDEQVTLNNAQMLVQQANIQWQVQHDKAATVVLLQTAQQRVNLLNSARLQPLAHAIMQDIALVSSKTPLDYAALNQQFIQLTQEVNALTLPQGKTVVLNKPRAIHNWHDAWQYARATLRKMIVVQRLDQNITPLLQPQQLTLFKEYLILLLADAQTAALRQNAPLYQSFLEQAEQAIAQHLSLDAAESKKLLSQITVLQNTAVQNMDYPELSALAQAQTLQTQMHAEASA